jgi:hypothetical protein
MERVAELLDPQNQAFSYRQALVRLWIMASDDRALNQWEQQANEKTIVPQVQSLLDKLQDERAIDTDTIHSHPLALIRALDDYLASVRLPSSQSSSLAETTYLYDEGGKHYWLVPVTLAARRLAAMNRQPARLARWFHHHAVLPRQTASHVEVTCTLARSGLDTCLANLTSQEQATLKVWIAHFDDGADVVWDTTASPIGNWRAQYVDPHELRQASAIQTLDTAAKAAAQVVVFPEFTLDCQHRVELANHLRRNPSSVQLVVAGAFHATPTQPPEERIYNTAPVFNANGVTLFEHRKLRLFGRDDVGAEFAEVGNRLHVLITPIGCMTVLICKDFLDEDPRVNNLLTEVPVDWAWVPSYGDETTLRAHQARAKRLAIVTTGTSCAVAQTQNTAMKKEGEDLGLLPGFGHAAGQKTPSVVQKNGGVVEFSLASQAVPTKPSGSPLKRIK